MTPAQHELFQSYLAPHAEPSRVLWKTHPGLIGVAVRLCGREEVNQAALIGVWKAALKFHGPPERFRTYATWKVLAEVTGLLRHMHGKVGTKTVRPKTHRASTKSEHGCLSWGDATARSRAVYGADIPIDPAEEVVRREQAAMVRSALEDLAPAQQESLEMYGQGMSQVDIAKYRKVDKSTTHRSLRRGLNKMKELLEDAWAAV